MYKSKISKIEYKWCTASIAEKEKLFKNNGYAWPEILARRVWRTLRKQEKDIFKASGLAN